MTRDPPAGSECRGGPEELWPLRLLASPEIEARVAALPEGSPKLILGAYIANRLGRYDECLQYYLESLVIATEAGDEVSRCRVLVNIASVGG